MKKKAVKQVKQAKVKKIKDWNGTKTPLTEAELKTLTDVLAAFETGLVKTTGVKYRSGGFATADMFNYDDDAIDIEVKWGVQSDCRDSVNVESWKMERSVLSDATKDVFKMVDDIEPC